MKIEELKKRFTSGNSVPVERAYLTKDEFNRLLRVAEISNLLFDTASGSSDERKAKDDLYDALRDLEQS